MEDKQFKRLIKRVNRIILNIVKSNFKILNLQRRNFKVYIQQQETYHGRVSLECKCHQDNYQGIQYMYLK